METESASLEQSIQELSELLLNNKAEAVVAKIMTESYGNGIQLQRQLIRHLVKNDLANLARLYLYRQDDDALAATGWLVLITEIRLVEKLINSRDVLFFVQRINVLDDQELRLTMISAIASLAGEALAKHQATINQIIQSLASAWDRTYAQRLFAAYQNCC